MPDYICSPSVREDFYESGGTVDHPHGAVNSAKEEERGQRQELLSSLSLINIDLAFNRSAVQLGLGL